MARYIDADNFRKAMIKRFGCIPCLTDYSEASRYDIPIDDALNLAPTADVAPKSEVARLEQDVTRLVQENEDLKDSNEHLAVMLEETKIELEAMRGAANPYKMHYDNAMREVARLTAERDAMHQDVNAAEEYAFLMRKEKDALIKTYKECTAEVIKEFAERLKIYYRNLDKTAGALVEYHIDQIAKEMLEGG